MTMPDSDIHSLVTAAQSTLADVESRGMGAQMVRLAFGGVQAGCAIALAIDRLATAVLAVVSTEETA